MKTGPRVIVHQNTATMIQDDGSNPIVTMGSNWEFDVSNATSWEIVCEEYIDLSGYVSDDLTFNVNDVVIQTGGPPIWIDYAASAGNRNQLFVSNAVYVTTTPIAQQNAANIFDGIIPGFLMFNNDGEQEILGLSPQEVVYGHVATYQSVGTITQALYALTQTNMSQFGMGKPIVADRLYVYQYWGITSVDDMNPSGSSRDLLGNFTTPPSNIVLIGDTTEEPDHVYLHRMAQQYQLQQNYDED